jgi:hypothetical protein
MTGIIVFSIAVEYAGKGLEIIGEGFGDTLRIVNPYLRPIA